MNVRPGALVAVAVAGGLVGVWLAREGYVDPRAARGLLDLFVGWSFIGVGVYAWWRRLGNRIGALMTATGFAWFVAVLGGASEDATVFTLAAVVGGLYHATTIHLLLAFPSGRLESPAARRVAVAGYGVFGLGNLAVWLVMDPRTSFDCGGCPANRLRVLYDDAVADAVIAVTNEVAAAFGAYVLVRLVVSWRRAPGWRRRAMAPLVFAAAATALLLSVMFLVQSVAHTATAAIFLATVAIFAVVPYAFLLGLARAAMLGGGAVGQLVTSLTRSAAPGELRSALRGALDDPTLELAYWLPERGFYVDGEGRRIELPPATGDRASVDVELDRHRVGALVYDRDLVGDAHLVAAVGSAAALAIENQRLAAELRAKLDDLVASRARIVEAADDARRRLERDLHDGAQQRLVSLALRLRVARAGLDAGSAASEALDLADRELARALGELRDLARGIHPAVLTDRGLSAALRSLAARTPFDVEVAAVPRRRLPDLVESAAYYIVAEALTNAIKHAHAAQARVCVTEEAGRLAVEITDDGVGGADPEGGSGLRGLFDRVATLGGTLHIVSRRGCGTAIRASIPCG